MELKDRLAFPFANRDMLAFQHGAAFGLRIVSQSTSGAALIIRGMTSEGLFSFLHFPTDNSIIATSDFRISDVPIWVTVTDKDGSLVQGDIYVTLSVTINGDILYELCSGLVYRQKSISWPYNNSQDIRPGGGKITVKSSADPAANTEMTLTCPAGQIWRVLAFAATLVADTNAADGHAVDGFGTVLIRLPLASDVWLFPDDTITSATDNRQATDNWGVLTAQVEQFFNPA